MLTQIYTELLYRPLLNGLIAAYVFLPGHDLGVAIIALTAVVRLLLHPLVARQYQSQRALAALQPEIQALRAKVKDQQEQARQLMALYKRAGVHPASGCLPVLIQLPVLFGIYRALADGLHGGALTALYGWIPHPEQINTLAFGLLDLARPNILLAVLAGAGQYIQSKLLLPPRPATGATEKPDMATMMMTQSLYIMPVMTVVFALGLPAGLSLYWVTTTVFGILQQVILKRRYDAARSAPIV